jgi:hypothetical protein
LKYNSAATIQCWLTYALLIDGQSQVFKYSNKLLVLLMFFFFLETVLALCFVSRNALGRFRRQTSMARFLFFQVVSRFFTRARIACKRGSPAYGQPAMIANSHQAHN